MSDCKISMVPDNIGILANLTTLSIYRCFLRTLYNICDLINLETLTINDNTAQLYIPLDISRLSNLTSLNLCFNSITDITNLYQLTQLTLLNLRNNMLSTLPIGISKLVQLTYLDISNNKLNVLPKEIIGLKKLKKLSVGLDRPFSYGLNLSSDNLVYDDHGDILIPYPHNHPGINKNVPSVNIYIYNI